MCLDLGSPLLDGNLRRFEVRLRQQPFGVEIGGPLQPAFGQSGHRQRLTVPGAGSRGLIVLGIARAFCDFDLRLAFDP